MLAEYLEDPVVLVCEQSLLVRRNVDSSALAEAESSALLGVYAYVKLCDVDVVDNGFVLADSVVDLLLGR